MPRVRPGDGAPTLLGLLSFGLSSPCQIRLASIPEPSPRGPLLRRLLRRRRRFRRRSMRTGRPARWRDLLIPSFPAPGLRVLIRRAAMNRRPQRRGRPGQRHCNCFPTRPTSNCCSVISYMAFRLIAEIGREPPRQSPTRLDFQSLRLISRPTRRTRCLPVERS